MSATQPFAICVRSPQESFQSIAATIAWPFLHEINLTDGGMSGLDRLTLSCRPSMLRKYVFLVAHRGTAQHWRARVVMNTGVKLILYRVVRNSMPSSVPNDFGSGWSRGVDAQLTSVHRTCSYVFWWGSRGSHVFMCSECFWYVVTALRFLGTYDNLLPVCN